MTDKMIEHRSGAFGGDWFKLIFSRHEKAQPLQHFLDKFNPDDYHIYKASGRFRQVTTEDFYNFEYSGYILLKKDVYDCDEINEQIRIIYDVLCIIRVRYFNKPLPPLSILNKIKLKEIII